MLYPTLQSLVQKTNSRYSLVIAVAKRARELSGGEEPLTDYSCDKPVSIAVHEIAENKVEIINY